MRAGAECQARVEAQDDRILLRHFSDLLARYDPEALAELQWRAILEPDAHPVLIFDQLGFDACFVAVPPPLAQARLPGCEVTAVDAQAQRDGIGPQTRRARCRFQAIDRAAG